MNGTTATLGLRVLALGALLPLAACFEVENGPAFSGGDNVPGLEASLYTVGRIESDEGPGVLPVDPEAVEEWHVRRALNGSYILSQPDGDEDDDMVVRPRHIQDGDYVIEYSSAPDENWLGLLQASGSGDARQFAFCISLDWDDADIIALAPQHGVRADDAGYGGIRIGADDPDALYALMADLWARSEISEWECTVMGVVRPPDFDVGTQDESPGKN